MFKHSEQNEPQPIRVPSPPGHLDPRSVALRALCITAYLEYQQRRGVNSLRYPSHRLAVEDGLTPRRGCRKKEVSIWLRLAQFIDKNHLLPQAFIKAQYSFIRGDPPVSTNMFLSEQALENYRKYLLQRPGNCKLELRIQTQFLELETYKKKCLGYGDKALEAVLDDETLSLSPLFRWSVATMAGMPQVAEVWYTAAVTQYLTNPDEYRETWGDCLPADRLPDENPAVAGKVGTR